MDEESDITLDSQKIPVNFVELKKVFAVAWDKVHSIIERWNMDSNTVRYEYKYSVSFLSSPVVTVIV